MKTNRVLPPSRRDMVNDHTNGIHRPEPNKWCEVCDVVCPKCLDPIRYRNSCHLPGLIPGDRKGLQAYKERMGL